MLASSAVSSTGSSGSVVGPGLPVDLDAAAKTIYARLTAPHRDTPALWFRVPPTVRTLSLSLHVATSGGGSPAGGSKGRHTRTALVTYDLLHSTPTVVSRGRSSNGALHPTQHLSVSATSSEVFNKLTESNLA